VYAPAELTWRRAALVNNINLARAAAAAGLQQHLVAHSRPLTHVIKRFAAAQQQQQQRGDAAAAAAGGVSGSNGGSSGGRVSGGVGGFLAGVVAAAGGGRAAAGGGGGGRAAHWGVEDEAVWNKVWLTNSFDEEDEGTAAAAAAAAGGDGAGGGEQQGSTAAVAGDGAGGGEGSKGGPSKLRAPKVLADLVESVVAAVLLDSSSGSGSRSKGYNWGEALRVLQRLLPSLRD